MEKLLDKIDKLKKSLEKEETVKKIRYLNSEIIKDEELINMIKEYKEEGKEELKSIIYSNSLYKEYKECETDLNLMIISINNKLKTIVSKEHCV